MQSFKLKNWKSEQADLEPLRLRAAGATLQSAIGHHFKKCDVNATKDLFKAE